ncbi:hypothetical protein ACFLYG_01960 [Chloroflexota bacterium]
MRLHTASEVISFAKKLENESANLYQDLSRRYVKDEDVFISFAKENEKNAVQIQRVYYGVISDAIEGCFAFDVESDEYTFEAVLAQDASYSDALDKALSIEEKIIRFYSDAATQSDSLMADVPRAFKLVAKKRGNRRAKLESLL